MNTQLSYLVDLSILKSQKPPKLTQLNNRELQCYFQNTWNLYEALFSSIIKEKTFYEQPDPLRNPLIFYFGHTAAFYINKLVMAGLIEEGVDAHYDLLFARGVDPDLPQNLDVSAYWPTVAEVRAYRKTIYDIVIQVIYQADFRAAVTADSPLWALLMCLEHDRIHFETSAVLIRQLDVDLVKRPKGWEYAPTNGAAPQNQWIEVQGGTVSFGKQLDSDIFGWDNEYGVKTVGVKPFAATKNLISNEEFLAFVQAAGYKNQALWSEEGWDWKTRTNTSIPKFWVAKKDTFRYRAMFDEMKLPLDWPALVNAHEAWAYCAWKGENTRLLTEAEFTLIAREGIAVTDDPLYSEDYNLDFAYGSCSPVGFMKNGQTKSGFNDLFGNVWDWLKDDFYPLDGFKAHPYYEDFSAPYMDKDHSMMAGGAWSTTGTGTSKYYRLWFRRHFFQHAGFRLAVSR